MTNLDLDKILEENVKRRKETALLSHASCAYKDLHITCDTIDALVARVRALEHHVKILGNFPG
jgi:hypothetical protein